MATGSRRRRAPARVRDRGEHVVLPASVDEQVRGCVALDLEAAPLEDRGAAGVTRHVVGRDPVQLPGPEREGNRAAHGLGHVALALLAGGQVVAEHARLERPPVDLGEVEVADDLARRVAGKEKGAEAGPGGELGRPNSNLLLPRRLVEEIRRISRRERLQVLAVLAVETDDLVHVRGLRESDDEPVSFNQLSPLSPQGRGLGRGAWSTLATYTSCR